MDGFAGGRALGKLRIAVLGALLAIPMVAAGQPPIQDSGVIYIQPIGSPVAREETAFVQEVLVAFYGMEVRILPAVPMPDRSRVGLRRRYRAERILETLDSLRPPDAFRIIGVTADDISAKQKRAADWGVIGLACCESGSCVVSSARCGGKAVDPKRRMLRLGKVAIHEIGHTLGLAHCTQPGCLMQDANGSVRTVDRESTICDLCWDRIQPRSGAPPQEQVLAP